MPNPADPDSPLINVAGVVAIAAQQDTVQARRFYAEFCKTWDLWKNLPYTDSYKQGEALKEALVAVKSDIPLTPVTLPG